MNKNIRWLSVALSVLLCISIFAACSDRTGSGDVDFIKVDAESLSREYIGYFFYVAQTSMLSEAGHTKENSTKEDISLYWETTEIEGTNAVDVARDVAADNAVLQKVQYLKAIQEGITLTQEEFDSIDSDIQTTAANNGGVSQFGKLLDDMGTDMNAYKQIITENIYIQKLYDKYDAQGSLNISDAELAAFSEIHANEYPPQHMLDLAKKEKFNTFAKQWEKDADIVIDDEAMKQFNV